MPYSRQLHRLELSKHIDRGYLLKKKPLELCAILWKTFYKNEIDDFLPLPQNGRVSFTSAIKMPHTYWQSIGYININNFAFRVDVFEKIFFLAAKEDNFKSTIGSG